MKMKRASCISLFALVVAASAVSAQAPAADFLKKCEPVLASLEAGAHRPSRDSVQEAVDSGYCLGYARGFTDSSWAVQAVKGKGHTLFCLPENNINLDLALRVIVRYMKMHPERLRRTESLLAGLAFREAFPCKD